MNENIALDKLAFGFRLNSIRRAKGMTSEQLSELCGVDNTHIRHIECGNRSPSIGLLVKICNVFQVSPYYFLQDSIKLGKVETISGLLELYPELSAEKAAAVEDIIQVLNTHFPEK